MDFAPLQNPQTGQFAQVPADLGRVNVNRPQNFGPRFARGQFDGLQSDRSEAELGNPDLRSRFQGL